MSGTTTRKRTMVRFISLLALLLPLVALADTLTGKVVKITNGDTMHVQVATTRYKIRLAGIDAPERDQRFGAESTENLSRLIAGERVTVEWNKKDRYRRIVGKILLRDQDICLEQVQAGFAWHYKEYQKDHSPEDRELYAQAEKQARLTKRGGVGR